MEIDIIVWTVNDSDFLFRRDLLSKPGETGYSLNMVVELAPADIERFGKGFVEGQFKVVYIMTWFEDWPFFVISLAWVDDMYLRCRVSSFEPRNEPCLIYYSFFIIETCQN